MLFVAAVAPSWRQECESMSITTWSAERTRPLITPKPAAQPVGYSTISLIFRKSAILRSSATEWDELPTSAGEPALCTPQRSIVSLAVDLIPEWDARLRSS